MGSGSGFEGDPEQSGHGRHRKTAPATAVAVVGTPGRSPKRHSRPEVGPLGAGRPVDPMTDSGSVGLQMFRLGSIPASVTPPRSWRRAAWFTVLASAAALAGLVVVGALLVSPARDTGRITALPYFPDGSPLAAIPGPSGTRQPDRVPGTPDERHPSPPSGTTARTGTDEWTDVAATTRLAAAPAPEPTHGSTAARPPMPVISTLPVVPATISGSDPVVDPAKLIKRTRTFFAEVTSDAKAAADLTTGTVHDEAEALIEQKYGDLTRVQIQSVSLDPANGLTVCVLRLVNRDGTTQTQRTTLRFTLTDDPKITNPGG
jgi:hypothetical protein